MTTATNNISFLAGDTFTYDLSYTDANGLPIDLTGATADMEIRDAATNVTVVETATGGILAPETNGELQFVLSDTQTQTMLPIAEASASFVYDVQITFADTTVFTIVQGSVAVTQSVTRP